MRRVILPFDIVALRGMGARLGERRRWLGQHVGVLLQHYLAYARLARLHQPVGIWLLLWPTLWALWIAGEGRPDQHVFIVLVLGTIVMRSAGCIVNDFADRKIDPHVQRTRTRPLATGEVSVVEAWILFLGLMLIGLGLVLTLNRLTQGLAVIGALITVVYPFSKRFISTPQFILGIAFAWGVPMAFAAQLGTVPRIGWLVFVGAVIWGVIYDTEYAMADREDDLKIGVRSTAILFGDLDRLFVGALQVMFLVALLLTGRSAGLGSWFLASVLLAAALTLYQQVLLKERESARCFAAFLNNVPLGACIFVGIALDYVFAG